MECQAVFLFHTNGWWDVLASCRMPWTVPWDHIQIYITLRCPREWIHGSTLFFFFFSVKEFTLIDAFSGLGEEEIVLFFLCIYIYIFFIFFKYWRTSQSIVYWILVMVKDVGNGVSLFYGSYPFLPASRTRWKIAKETP